MTQRHPDQTHDAPSNGPEEEQAEADAKKRDPAIPATVGLAVFVIAFLVGLAEGNESKPSAAFAGMVAVFATGVAVLVTTCSPGQLLLGALLFDHLRKR